MPTSPHWSLPVAAMARAKLAGAQPGHCRSSWAELTCMLSILWRKFRQTGVQMATFATSPNLYRPACRWLPIVLGLVLPAGGHAAPFCIGTESVPPQCIYYDANDCRKEANRQGGFCSANPNELHVSTNIGQFCLVTSQQVSLCIYLDRSTCDADAARQHGACVAAPGVAPSGAPDPFSATGGR